MLDPTRKDKWYGVVGWSPDWIRSCKADVKKLWNTTYKNKEAVITTSMEPPAKKPRNSVEDAIVKQMLSITRAAPEDELTKYLREPCSEPGTDILQWWKVIHNHKHLNKYNMFYLIMTFKIFTSVLFKINKGNYPNLSKMAKDYLSIFGTGVPVERLFSSATDTLTHRRYSLKPSTINECLCLKSWYKLQAGDVLHNQLAVAVKEMILGDDDAE